MQVVILSLGKWSDSKITIRKEKIIIMVSGTMDNLLIEQMVTLDCHRGKRNLSIGVGRCEKGLPLRRSWMVMEGDAGAHISVVAVRSYL